MFSPNHDSADDVRGKEGDSDKVEKFQQGSEEAAVGEGCARMADSYK